MFRSLVIAAMIIIGLLLLFPAVVPVTNYIIKTWLPVYEESMPLFVIFYIGAIFTIANVAGIAINALNRQILYQWTSLFMVVISFCAYMIVNHLHLSLKYYAYVSSAAQILNFIILMGTAYLISIKASQKNLLNFTKGMSKSTPACTGQSSVM